MRGERVGVRRIQIRDRNWGPIPVPIPVLICVPVPIPVLICVCVCIRVGVGVGIGVGVGVGGGVGDCGRVCGVCVQLPVSAVRGGVEREVLGRP